MAYRVVLRPAAQRDLRRLRRSNLDRLEMAILGLGGEPRPHHSEKLRGAERACRLRVGSYRVLYEISDTENLILVTRVHRRSETTYRRP